MNGHRSRKSVVSPKRFPIDSAWAGEIADASRQADTAELSSARCPRCGAAIIGDASQSEIAAIRLLASSTEFADLRCVHLDPPSTV